LEIANISSSHEKVTEQRDFVTYNGDIEGNKFILSENKAEIMKTITIQLPDYLVRELPEEESAIHEILKFGLKQLKIEKAIERYKQGNVSLAKVAELAGISIREMIPIAYAHGLEPKYDESLIESKINPEMAINL
jgi:predicted HTH domain antitoxin